MDALAPGRVARTFVVGCIVCAPLAAYAEDQPAPAASSEAATPSPPTDAPAPTPATPPPAPARTFEVSAYDVDGNTLLDNLAIETAVYPFLGPGRTVEDVESARAALEKAYQSRGYQSVVVQVPAQTVASGIVKLHVTETRVGRVRVVGAEYHLPSAVREEMPSLQEGHVPDFHDVQRDIADVNRLPDQRVTPTMKPGRVPGTVDVDLHVSDDLPLHASLELNNDHSQNTRELRALANVRYTNLWQLGHTLSVTYLTAPQNLDNAQVFSASYSAPIWGTPWTILGYGYTSSSAVAALGGTGVLNDGFTAGVRGILNIGYSDSISQSLNFGIDVKHSDQQVGAPSPIVPMTYYPLSLAYSLQYATDDTTANLAITAVVGVRGIGSDTAEFELNRAFAEANFAVLKVDADVTQQLGGGTEAAARFAGQIADKPLVAAEQISAGGNTSVRGYLQSEAVGDDGIVGSVEVRSPSIAAHVASFIDDWRFYGFVDAGQIWFLKPLAEQQSSFSLYSVGVGTRIVALKYLHGDFAIGLPLRSGPATQRNDPQAIFSVKAEF